LHGRKRGETFGLSCLEFAVLGKGVLTYADSPERAHLDILGEAAMAYRNERELRELLRRPVVGGGRRAVDGRWKKKFRQYQPEEVMRKFQQVFLQ